MKPQKSRVVQSERRSLSKQWDSASATASCPMSTGVGELLLNLIISRHFGLPIAPPLPGIDPRRKHERFRAKQRSTLVS